MSDSIILDDYQRWLAELKSRIQGARTRAAMVVNEELVRLYHHIGSEILVPQRREEWCTQVIVRLAADLAAAFLRDGKAPGLDPDFQYAAVALLATRKIIDDQREAELRKLIDTAQLGARPNEVIDAPEMDPRRREVAEACVHWLHEWREVARVAINRRDFRIALGLAQRRQSSEEGDAIEEATAVSAQVAKQPSLSLEEVGSA